MVTPTPAVRAMVRSKVRTKITRRKVPGQFQGVSAQKKGGDKKADVGPDHEDIAVGEVDQQQHAVDHGIAQGDEGIKAAPLQGVDEVLQEESRVIDKVLKRFTAKVKVASSDQKLIHLSLSNLTLTLLNRYSVF